MRDRDALVKACQGAEVIYNLAAEHADDVRPISLYYDVNVGGARNLVAAAEKNQVGKIVFTSTVALYGLNVGVPDESFPARPFNDYGKSKWEAEQVFQGWVEADSGRSLAIVRPVVIFGEGNRGNVYNLLRQIASGRFVQVGRGKNVKSMGYVENIAKFLTYCLGFGPGSRIYNYLDEPDLTTGELVAIAQEALGMRGALSSIPYPIGLAGGYLFDALARLTGKRFPISSVRIKKFCANTAVSAEKLRKTEFEPEFSLREGLERVIRDEFLNMTS